MFSILFYLILQNINCNIQSNGAGLQHNRLSKFINADMSSTMSGYSPTSAIHFVECFSNHNAEHRTRNSLPHKLFILWNASQTTTRNTEHGTRNSLLHQLFILWNASQTSTRNTEHRTRNSLKPFKLKRDTNRSQHLFF
jgi:hypothetical protein